MNAHPLLLSRERTFIYGGLLAAICLLQVKLVVAQGFGDWSAFWAAGATAGTRDLLDPQRHNAWMLHHHLLSTIFPYLPGAAWLLLPIKSAPLALGYAVNFAVMAALTIAGALLASKVYRIARGLCVLFAFAWAPAIAALATGQNSPLGFLLVMIAIAGIAADSWGVAGVAVGVLLYKLPYALPMVALLLLRRNWRALSIVALCGAVWYAASAAATAGDWHWPLHYADALRGYAGADARFNAMKAIGIPELLTRAGVPQGASILCGAALFLASLPALMRRSKLEAASFVPLLGLAFGPHTLPYDLALMLPALYYLMTHAPEPLRTRAVCAIYLVAPLWLLSGIIRFDVLAVVCDGLALVWLVKGVHESTAGPYIRIADPGNRSEA
ncbi:MAG TPA: glycosyltransferase 87 family protein [Candidatus Baltobacteraceae bacterium]|nr:glycosyltransferase 87 family protein [Candidatus Baltobacteraceae bacterium]